jgi:hypothetical protein
MRIGDGTASDRPVGVVSAIISAGDRPGQMLLGVRRVSAVATRHPGVISTPTVRLPADLFEFLIRGHAIPDGTVGMFPVSGPRVRLGRSGHVVNSDAYLLESLLTRKLGLADALGDGTFEALATPRYLSLVEVEDPLGTEEPEWTAMLSYDVRIVAGAGLIPVETGAYKRLLWIDAERLPLALDRRDAMLLDETLNVFEVCAHGLCLRVAAEMLVADKMPAADERLVADDRG